MLRRSLLSLILLLLAASMAHAVDTITIDFGGTPMIFSVNAANKAMLGRLMARENTRRAAQSPPLAALRLEDFTRDLMIDMLRGYQVQSAGHDATDACVAFKALSGVNQAAITTQLGGVSPCP